jgi:hypothetical protein
MRNLNQSTKKAICLCALSAALSVAMGSLGFYGAKGVAGRHELLTDKNRSRAELAQNMTLNHRRVRDFLNDLGSPALGREEAQSAAREARKAVTLYEESNGAYKALGITPGQQEAYYKMNAAWREFKNAGEALISQHTARKITSGGRAVEEFYADFAARSDELTEASGIVLAFHERATVKNPEATVSAKNTYLLGLVLISLGCGIVLAIIAAFALTLGPVAKWSRVA